MLAEVGVPVEPGVSHLQNMKRLHTDICSPDKEGGVHIPCLFEDSRLARESREVMRPEDDEDQQARHKAQAELLKQAHTTISGLGKYNEHCSLHGAQLWKLEQRDRCSDYF